MIKVRLCSNLTFTPWCVCTCTQVYTHVHTYAVHIYIVHTHTKIFLKTKIAKIQYNLYITDKITLFNY